MRNCSFPCLFTKIAWALQAFALLVQGAEGTAGKDRLTSSTPLSQKAVIAGETAIGNRIDFLPHLFHGLKYSKNGAGRTSKLLPQRLRSQRGNPIPADDSQGCGCNLFSRKFRLRRHIASSFLKLFVLNCSFCNAYFIILNFCGLSIGHNKINKETGRFLKLIDTCGISKNGTAEINPTGWPLIQKNMFSEKHRCFTWDAPVFLSFTLM